SIGPATELMSLAPQILASVGEREESAELALQLEKILDGVDAEFISEEVPHALSETLEGIERVTSIVRAMKDFSHPGGDGVELADLNHAVETTLQVARNEYKYYADVVTDLGELPRVGCWVDDLNQVFLNLIVNGAHAIHDRLGDSEERGTLTIASRMDGDTVELRFGDTGCGVPEDARAKIYDQFFTTKEIGRGTGLGLAIARSVVVDKHGGTLDFETEVGVGTTFIIRLPAHQHHSLEEKPVEADPVC
ncbi:MAG: two-component system NtrC family sensor kinase, partial [Pseudohongiellaceae bacterium]